MCKKMQKKHWTIDDTTAQAIENLAKETGRSQTKMADILLKEALEMRKMRENYNQIPSAHE
jgi:hypothetical protein|tara:strand:+ start:1063 stop:1245 length:183 start_codon:yes stop_codon:yes gene_type:complete